MSDELNKKDLDMYINLDDENRANRSRFTSDAKSTTSSSKWILIIAMGVFLGTTASTLSVRVMDNAILKYQLHELNKKLKADQARMRAKQEEQNKINAARLKQQQIENQEKQAGLRQAMETCNFWQEEYKKERTSYNKMHRDQSCNFVNEFR
ncbi:MAG: hypothetical protein HUJ23_12150 [Methylophaga sp.]|nr:hypothetical protein [Methylophaga sp.]